MTSRYGPRRATRARGGPLWLVLALAGSVAACNSLLDVKSPTTIPANSIEVPGNAELLVSGAISDYDCAQGVYDAMAGLMTDEMVDATQTADRWVYDQRSVHSSDARYAVNDCENLGTYTPANQARQSADHVRALLESWTDAQVPSTVNRTELIGLMQAYGAYARVLLGEMFCTSVLSGIDLNGNIVYGTEISSEQMFQSADSLFTAAIATAQTVGNDSLLTFAYAGRARTRLDLGDKAAAKADAQQVPTTFVWVSSASSASGRRHNRLWDESNKVSGQSSAVDTQYVDMHDPRVPFGFENDSSTTGVPLYYQLKYTDVGSPIPIASGREARLIEAEGDVAGGDAAGAVGLINALRDTYAIAHYSGPVSTDAVQAQIVEERRRELFLQGQRVGDVRRYNVTLKPLAGEPYRNGGVYGNTICLPLPDVERQNNPNL